MNPSFQTELLPFNLYSDRRHTLRGWLVVCSACKPSNEFTPKYANVVHRHAVLGESMPTKEDLLAGDATSGKVNSRE